jgi:hypothetical protein
MIKKIYAGLAATFILLAGYTYAKAWDTKEMNRQIDGTNFLVNDGCSGTLLKDNHILTAAHCIIGQYRTVEKEVIKDDGTVKKEKFRIVEPGTISQNTYAGPAIIQTNKYVYKIVKTDRSTDLALLQSQTTLSAKPAELACSDIVRGDRVFAVGNSFAVLYSTITDGMVSSVNRSYRDLGLVGDLGDTTDDGEHGLVQHSAPIAGGNSGGALYNVNGKLVGVNVRGRPGGFSFAVPLDDVKKFLGENFKVSC